MTRSSDLPWLCGDSGKDWTQVDTGVWPEMRLRGTHEKLTLITNSIHEASDTTKKSQTIRTSYLSRTGRAACCLPWSFSGRRELIKEQTEKCGWLDQDIRVLCCCRLLSAVDGQANRRHRHLKAHRTSLNSAQRSVYAPTHASTLRGIVVPAMREHGSGSSNVFGQPTRSFCVVAGESEAGSPF